MILMQDYIRDRNGRIKGFVDTDSQGNKVARTREGRIVGYYKSKMGITTDPFGKIVSYSDTVVSLIPLD